MPRFSTIKTDLMADLAEQVRFASRAALLKQIEQAEALAAELEPERTYPEDWLVFRVTGFVPEHGAARLLEGRAVLADLSALTERLCAAAALHELDLAGAAGAGLDTGALCTRWGVTRRSVERYRREGLVARRVISDSARGRVRLVFSRAGVEAFERRHGIRVTDTPPPPRRRASGADRAGWIAWAQRFKSRAGCPWAEVIRRLSRRTGRSEAVIRRALSGRARSGSAAAGAASERLIKRGAPIRAGERRFLVRAARAGVELPALARRYGRGTPAVARALVLGRIEFLRTLRLPEHGSAEGTPDEAWPGDALLRAADAPWPRDAQGVWSLLAVQAGARESAPNADVERALARAHAGLLGVAAGVLRACVGRVPNADDADRAETALRWASRLRRRLLRAALPLLARTLRERGLMRGGPDAREAALAVRALDAAAAAIHAWSPDRGGRVAAPISLALARELAVIPAPGAVDTALSSPAGPVLAPWDAALSMPPWVERGLESLDERERAAVRARFGTDEEPPMTMREIRERLGFSAPAWWSVYRKAARAGMLEPRHGAGARSPRDRPRA